MLRGNEIIPPHDIQKSRQLGLWNITSLTDKVNYLYTFIKKNLYEPEGRLFLNPAQISRKITNIGMDIVGNKQNDSSITQYMLPFFEWINYNRNEDNSSIVCCYWDYKNLGDVLYRPNRYRSVNLGKFILIKLSIYFQWLSICLE